MCIKNINFHFITKTAKKDAQAKHSYGESWINVYLSKSMLKNVMLNIKRDTKTWGAVTLASSLSQGVGSIPARMEGVEYQINFYIYRNMRAIHFEWLAVR